MKIIATQNNVRIDTYISNETNYTRSKIAKIIKDDELTTEFVLPDAFDPRVGKEVSASVAKAARETGVARI